MMHLRSLYFDQGVYRYKAKLVRCVDGDTAGELNVQVAQNTSSATASTVKFGSYLEYMKF